MKNRCLPKKQSVTYLRRKILSWYKNNVREYPWRETNDPYRVLIAEMMLQRTKADQVKDVYTEFFRRFHTPREVAEAPQEKLDRILEPLGLKWRFPNFKNTSQEIVGIHDGQVPTDSEDLKRLQGVGEYVSGLVQSVAFKKKAWIVDSNIVRIYERFFGLDTKSEARRDPLIIAIAKQYSETTKPKEANLGLIDFGALVCKPTKPECKSCPVNRKCVYKT